MPGLAAPGLTDFLLERNKICYVIITLLLRYYYVMLKHMLRICKCQILSRLELPSLKLYTFVSFVSFAVLVLFVSHPSSEFNNDENNSDTSTTLQPIQTLQKLTAELSDEDDTVQNQPIHWLAAVICVNTGNFRTRRRLE